MLFSWAQKIWLYILVFSGILVCFRGIYLFFNPSITIRWSTASEFYTLGYLIYRDEEGVNNEILITQEMIPSSQDPLTGGKYQYTDYEVDPDKSYSYSLIEVTNSGDNIYITGEKIYVLRRGIIEFIGGIIIFNIGCLEIILNKKRIIDNVS